MLGELSIVSKKRYFNNRTAYPLPGSTEEKDIFRSLQREFTSQFQNVFPDRLAQKTIIVVPSLTLDREILTKIRGYVYYEERMLCLLMLLRMPQTQVVYVSSVPIDQVIVDYYLHLLPGITGHHARQRLTMLSCHDASARSLTEKILERPRLLNRIKQKIADPHNAHLICFNVSDAERSLAVQLGIPVYGCDPDLLFLGTKTGSRLLFKECNLRVPNGFENLHAQEEIAEALYLLKVNEPALRKAILKINDGFGGEGNAVFHYDEILHDNELKEAIHFALASLHVVASNVNPQQFLRKFGELGGIVEAFIEADVKTSPSVQCRINPLGEVDIISTHDQVLGGEENQVFIGAAFPAAKDYAAEVACMAERVAKLMATQGVLGRFSIDFLSVFTEGGWRHYALEINLRKGGTTHPFLMLQFLTDGVYDAPSGCFQMPNGQSRFYFASDNVESPAYIGLTPSDLIDIAMFHGLMYDSTTQEGVMFHLIGALSQYGKLGMVCIASSHERAQILYQTTIEILDHECIQKDF